MDSKKLTPYMNVHAASPMEAGAIERGTTPLNIGSDVMGTLLYDNIHVDRRLLETLVAMKLEGHNVHLYSTGGNNALTSLIIKTQIQQLFNETQIGEDQREAFDIDDFVTIRHKRGQENLGLDILFDNDVEVLWTAPEIHIKAERTFEGSLDYKYKETEEFEDAVLQNPRQDIMALARAVQSGATYTLKPQARDL